MWSKSNFAAEKNVDLCNAKMLLIVGQRDNETVEMRNTRMLDERNWRLQKLQSTMFAMCSESNVVAAEKNVDSCNATMLIVDQRDNETTAMRRAIQATRNPKTMSLRLENNVLAKKQKQQSTCDFFAALPNWALVDAALFCSPRHQSCAHKCCQTREWTLPIHREQPQIRAVRRAGGGREANGVPGLGPKLERTLGHQARPMNGNFNDNGNFFPRPPGGAVQWRRC